MQTPKWVREMSDELLLHSYWENAPPYLSTWYDKARAMVREATEAPPWQKWSHADWVNAAMLASFGVAIVSECVHIYKMAKNA